MHGDEVAVNGHDVGNQNSGRGALLITLKRRRPTDGDGFLAGNFEKEPAVSLLQCERRFASAGIEMDAHRHAFRQNQMDQPKRIRERTRKTISRTDALIEESQLEKSQVRQTGKVSHE